MILLGSSSNSHLPHHDLNIEFYFLYSLVLREEGKTRRAKRGVEKEKIRKRKFYFTNTNPYIFLLLKQQITGTSEKEWQEFVKWRNLSLSSLNLDTIWEEKGRNFSHLIFSSACFYEHRKKVDSYDSYWCQSGKCAKLQYERELMLIPSFFCFILQWLPLDPIL